MRESEYPARWWHALEDGRLQCDLRPRDCKLHEGQRGMCFVRQRTGDRMVLATYGRSSGYWDISKSREMDRLTDEASPEAIARAAEAYGCRSVAFTYNAPVIFAEYAMDVADACHARGIQTVAVTAGYMHAEPRREFYAKMDAANVDLKAFTEDFYFQLTAAHLKPVLETLEYLRHETKTWQELTTLLIPGKNDSDAEVGAMSEWLLKHLGPDVPLFFTAFHPDYKLRDIPPTPPETLRRAREIARKAGLRYVYMGNTHDPAGETTLCPDCGGELIVRDWHGLLTYRLTEEGRCPDCGTKIPGHFDAKPGDFGRRRRPVAVM